MDRLPTGTSPRRLDLKCGNGARSGWLTRIPQESECTTRDMSTLMVNDGERFALSQPSCDFSADIPQARRFVVCQPPSAFAAFLADCASASSVAAVSLDPSSSCDAASPKKPAPLVTNPASYSSSPEVEAKHPVLMSSAKVIPQESPRGGMWSPRGS